MEPDIRYARSDGFHIAFQVSGDGPIDIVHVPGILFTLESVEDEPLATFRRRLEEFSRVVLFDKRGTGLSDRLPVGATPTIEERIDDVRAVMDAAGVERAALMGVADGGPVAMCFAATYPERVVALSLSATAARVAWAHDYPWGYRPEQLELNLAAIERQWGSGMMARFFSAAEDARLVARNERRAGTPAAAREMHRLIYSTDVRDVLSAISAPTLIVHNTDHPLWPIEGARYLAERIEDAHLVELPGRPSGLTASQFLDETEIFLTGRPRTVEVDRVLKTVIFTDIVGSTERAAELGDRRWRELLDSHDLAIRRQLERFRGVEVKATGDGFLAAFDGPARAIRCAQVITGDAQGLGLDVRCGVHTGECEVRGDDLAGIAVHIGARVAALAGPREVLVTSTVRDLVVGAGIEFADRGRHQLKGVPGKWHVLAVV